MKPKSKLTREEHAAFNAGVRSVKEPDYTAAIVMSRELYRCEEDRSHPVIWQTILDAFHSRGEVYQLDKINEMAIAFQKKYAKQDWEEVDFEETVCRFINKQKW